MSVLLRWALAVLTAVAGSGGLGYLTAAQQPSAPPPTNVGKCKVSVVLTEEGTPLEGDIVSVVPVFGEKAELNRLGSGTTDAKGRAEISFACQQKTTRYGLVLAAGPKKDICCMVPHLDDGKMPMFSCGMAPDCGSYTFHAKTFSLSMTK